MAILFRTVCRFRVVKPRLTVSSRVRIKLMDIVIFLVSTCGFRPFVPSDIYSSAALPGFWISVMGLKPRWTHGH